MVDIHSHVINNIDDGSKSIEDSIEMLKNLSEAGITDIIFTPHYIVDTDYQQTFAKRNKAYNNLVNKIKEEKIKINTYLANEIFIDVDIKKYIKKDKLTINGGDYILLEFPMTGRYNNSYGIIAGLIDEGYKVILAHPERYHTVQKDIHVLDELKELGVMFQSNIGSLYGAYGSKPKKAFKKLIKNKYIDFLATDIHRPSYKYSNIVKLEKKLKRYCDSEYFEKITYKNAKYKLLRKKRKTKKNK